MGGLEKKLYDFFVRVDRSRFRLVACALKEGGYFRERLLELDVPFYEGLQRHRFDVLAFPRLARVLRHESIDLIYTFSHPNTVLMSHTARSLGLVKRTVVSYHATGSREHRLVPRYVVPVAARADALLALADMHRRALVEIEGLPDDKFTVIPNGVDLELFHPGRDDALRAEFGFGPNDVVFVTVASLKPVKGIDVLIDGAGAVAMGNESIKFLFVGDGPDRAALEERARARGLGDRAVFAGIRDDVDRVYRAADALVLPSRSEAYPNVVLEAMASGLAVVATDVGSVREVVEESNAIVVASEDAEALAAAVDRLAVDPVLRRSMGRRGREFAEARHGIDRMCRAREDLFARLLGEKGTAE